MPKAKIKIIYSNKQSDTALKIFNYLIFQGLGESAESFEGLYVLYAKDEKIYDSAIVLVSEDFSDNNNWVNYINEIESSTRIIPVGELKNIGDDREKIPQKITDINFIKIDNNYLENIYEAMIMDPEYYHIRNKLMFLMQHDQPFTESLLSNRKYNKIIKKRLEREKNEDTRLQLTEITDYLKINFKQGLSNLWSEIMRFFWVVCLGVLAIVIIVLIVRIGPYYKRGDSFTMLLTQDVNPHDAHVSAIKALDVLWNPMIPVETKSEYYEYLTECLDENWAFSQLGYNYKASLNSAVIMNDRRYIYTANGNGMVTKWDIYSGEIVYRENVSDYPLNTIAKTNDDNKLVCIDSQGRLFIKTGDGEWNNTEIITSEKHIIDMKISVSEDGKYVAVADDEMVYLVSMSETNHSLIYKINLTNIDDVELDKGGKLWCIVRDNDSIKLYSITTSGEIDSEKVLGVGHNRCKADIKSDKVCYTDNSGKVFIVDTETGEREETGLILHAPIMLTLSDEDVIAYYDRNKGIHLYDYTRKTDLGDCAELPPSADRITIDENVMILSKGGSVFSKDISPMLYSDQVTGSIQYEFDGKSASDTGLVKNVSIEKDYVVKVDYEDENGMKTFLFDVTNRYFVGEAQKNNNLASGFPKTVYYSHNNNVHSIGKVTVVGTVSGEDVVVIGTSDGHFFELYFVNGDCLNASKKQVPSHTAISSITMTTDSYYLKDATGAYYKSRVGYPILKKSVHGIIDTVKERIHTGVTKELVDMIDPDLTDRLQLHILPGSDGEVWE